MGEGTIILFARFTEPAYRDEYEVRVLVYDSPDQVAGALEHIAAAMRRIAGTLSL